MGNISRWVNSVTYVGPDKVTGLPENFTRTFTDFQQSFLIQKRTYYKQIKFKKNEKF